MKRITKIAEKVGKILLILMLSISQFSFPLEVLADELNNEVEETVQEGLTENENITEIEDDLPNQEEEIVEPGDETTEDDSDVTEEVQESILAPYTELKYIDGTYYVKGGKEYLTVEEVLNNFNTEEIENELESNLSILNIEEEQLEDIDTVHANYKLVVITNDDTETIIAEYLLKIEGDYTEDDLVNEEDAKILVDKILADEKNEFNEEKPFDILDATNPVFTTGSWENTVVNQDELKVMFENPEELAIGEELVVKFYFTGFEFDSLTGIQGKINYDKTLLELKNIEIDNIYGNINEEGKFAYLLDNYQSNEVLMTMTFTAIASGETTIAIEDFLASTGVLVELDNDYFETGTITIHGKGGDVPEEEVIPEPVVPENTTEVPEQVVSPTTTISTPSRAPIRRVTLSSDNLIKSLEIKDHSINFDQNVFEYSIKVKNKVKKLDLTIELNNEKASYTVVGNENFKVGDNTVTITVTAEDGSTKTYTIKVKREEKEEVDDETEEEIEESSSSKTIIIILIVLVIIGLIYVIFKDDEEDKKESKK